MKHKRNWPKVIPLSAAYVAAHRAYDLANAEYEDAVARQDVRATATAMAAANFAWRAMREASGLDLPE